MEMQCQSCHGSMSMVGAGTRTGWLNEPTCEACHDGVNPSTTAGGPHGLHPIGASWVSAHQDAASAACRTCHGADYRGTVLSKAQSARTLSAFGTKARRSGWAC